MRLPLPWTCRSGPSLALRAAMPGHVALDEDGGAPGERGLAAGDDVLGGRVEGPGAGVLGRLRPVRREDHIGASAQEQVERLGHDRPHHLAHQLVPVGHGPAALGEPAAVVLARSSGRLHDPIEGQEGRDDELAHGASPFVASWSDPSQHRAPHDLHPSADSPDGSLSSAGPQLPGLKHQVTTSTHGSAQVEGREAKQASSVAG
jgi:hypothetical protein